ncbi:hypothetical protein ABZ527_32985 [Streptomyces griseofuscus]|uniref:hypothetical protein n=1 Tax=Streptomyces griseofuscus TaxID=146922 RepID=UPI0033C87B43
MRRALQRIDGDALDTAVGSWLAGRERAAGQAENSSDRPLPSLTVDGRIVRGARRTDGTQVHLLAAVTGTGLVTAQREADDRTRATAYGRDEIRRITAVTVTGIAIGKATWNASTG